MGVRLRLRWWVRGIVPILLAAPLLAIGGQAGAAPALFQDGFETGDLSNWTNPAPTNNPVNNGLAASQSPVFAGTYAARAVSTGLGASAWHTLTATQTNLYYQTRFNAASHNTSVNLLRFRRDVAAANAIATLSLSTTNRLTIRNDAGSPAGSVTGTTVATPGNWHTVQLHVNITGASSLTEVWLDGNPQPDLTRTWDLGVNPIGRIELGDPGSATTTKTFDVSYDDVAYDTAFIGDVSAPTAATGLTATAHSGLRVDLAWTPGTDDVGVTSYDVYRNNVLITNIPAASTYSDTTVAPLTAYTYKLVSKDTAGNSSPASNNASVTTTDAFSDGFEAGTLDKWTAVNGLAVQQTEVDTGLWAAEATSTGAVGASAQVTLDATVTDLTYRVRFKLISQGVNSVNLLRMRTATNGAIGSVFVSSTGKLSFRNDTTSATTASTLTVTPGVWHEVELHLLIAGASGQADTLLDGASAVSQVASLGTSPIGRLELGDPSVARTFDVAFDNVLANPVITPGGDTTPPAAPTNLHTTAVLSNEIDLAWNAATDNVGVTGYKVYRNNVVVATLGNVLTYANTGLAPATAYQYKVTALDAAGNESAASNIVNATTTAATDTTAPTAPSSLHTTAVLSNEIDLAWNASTDNVGVTGYRVYRNNVAIITLGNVLTYANTGLTPSTAYQYKVTALDAAGNESLASNVINATTTAATDTTAPTAPTNLHTTAVLSNEIDLAWNASTDNVGVTGYKVYRNNVVVATLGNVLTYANTGLTPSTAYQYKVTALDAAGNESLASNIVNATTTAGGDITPPTAPATVTATAVSDTQVTVTWTAGTDNVGVTGYRVFRNGSTTQLVQVSGTTLTYTDTTATPDSTVSYAIRSVDAAANISPLSPSASTVTPAFTDGFETGNFTRWTTNNGLTAQQTTVDTGSWAALALSTTTNSARYASKTLPTARTNLYYRERIRIISNTTATVNVLRLRTAAGGNIVSLTYNGSRQLGYHDDIMNTTTTSTTALALNTWYEVKVHVVINGASSQIEVWLNGAKITTLSKTDKFGNNAIGQVAAGETATGHNYNFAIDNVWASTQAN